MRFFQALIIHDLETCLLSGVQMLCDFETLTYQPKVSQSQ